MTTHTDCRVLDFTLNGGEHSLFLPQDGLATTIATEILEGQSYPVFTWMKDIHRIVDVGACFGAASVFFATIWPEATIRSYEPDTESFALLCQNAEGRRIQPNLCALGHGTVLRTIYAAARGSVCNSLLPIPDPIRARKVQQLDARNELQLPIDILKIDTEGMELPILERIADRLPEIRFIYLEFHSTQDRLAMERLLLPTHDLYACRMMRANFGEVLYVRKGERE